MMKNKSKINLHVRLQVIYKSIISAVLLLLSFTTLAQLQQNDQLTRSIDSLVAPQFEGNQPGISILIAKKGQVVYKKAFGSANLELNTPMQPDNVFRIGSITKQFTAVAILQLVEQGKISLQDSVQKYIKDFPSKGYTVTIENLLTHTSGIVDYTSKDDPDPYIERRDFTPEFLINYIKNDPLHFKPGSKYEYSNSNYLLLGYIIQLVSGENYHQYMADHVLKPAGLAHTLYAEEHTAVPGRVQGYTHFSGSFDNCDYQTLSLGFACGDLLSNTGDLLKWNQAVIACKLISEASLKKAFSPYQLANGTYSSYGYGWFIDTTYGSPCIHHEGQTSGFISLEKYFPKEDTYVAVMTNVKTSDDKTDFSDNRFRLFDEIGQLAMGKELIKEVRIDDKTLNSYAGTYKSDNPSAQKSRKDGIFIRLENGKLYATLANGTGLNMYLSPQSATLFLLPDVKRIKTTIEFIITDGQVSGLYWTQEEKIKIKKVQ
ncbi:MAG TPA: serine hydrolase domain-containing protein [Mucilaginibacter sp.]|nr:serine hydrolase domain-containing protein [Mucilaginibacter sp.]